MTCRTCGHLCVDRSKEHVRKGKVYACGYAPALPHLPAAITDHHGFKWPPMRRRMEPDDGVGCPCYDPLKK